MMDVRHKQGEAPKNTTSDLGHHWPLAFGSLMIYSYGVDQTHQSIASHCDAETLTGQMILTVRLFDLFCFIGISATFSLPACVLTAQQWRSGKFYNRRSGTL